MDLSEKLSSVLSDPKSMAKIAEIARGLSLPGEPQPPAPTQELAKMPYLSELSRFVGKGGRERVALLSALKPYLKREKRARLERILTVLNALNLLAALPGEGRKGPFIGEN